METKTNKLSSGMKIDRQLNAFTVEGWNEGSDTSIDSIVIAHNIREALDTWQAAYPDGKVWCVTNIYRKVVLVAPTIRDTDMAEEMQTYSQDQGQDQQPGGVLNLLQ